MAERDAIRGRYILILSQFRCKGLSSSACPVQKENANEGDVSRRGCKQKMKFSLPDLLHPSHGKREG